jgi:hypothetical protein
MKISEPLPFERFFYFVIGAVLCGAFGFYYAIRHLFLHDTSGDRTLLFTGASIIVGGLCGAIYRERMLHGMAEGFCGYLYYSHRALFWLGIFIGLPCLLILLVCIALYLIKPQ